MPISVAVHSRLAGFAPEARRQLLTHGGTHTIPADGYLFMEGEPSGTLYFILEGTLKLTRNMPNGREVLLDLLGPGDTAGEAAALAELPHVTSAQARSRVTVFRIEKTPYLTLLQSNPEYFQQYMQEAGLQALRMTRRLAEVLSARVPSRLAYLLLMLDERFGSVDESAGVDVRLTRRELAEMTGMRLESAIRALRVMEDRNVLAFNPRGVVIKRRRCLELIASLGCDCDSGSCPLGAKNSPN